MSKQVFISYPRDNAAGQALARALYSDLQKEQISAFLDEHSIEPGDRWLNTLKQGVADCKIMLSVISDASGGRAWVEKEFNEAQKHDVRIIPVLAEAVDIPIQFSGIQAVLLYGEDAEAQQGKLFAYIREYLGIDAIAPLIKDAIQAKRIQAYDIAIAKWQEVLQLTPANQRANKEIERLTQLNERKQQGATVLQQLAMRFIEIQPVFADIAAILNQAEERPEAAALIQTSQQFLENALTAEDFIQACLAICKPTKSVVTMVTEPYIRQHTIYPDEFPESWASGWGEDEFGLWMAFTYKGARQQFRWCEPGTFLMGSPEDEPERLSYETQHEVILSKGFWISDTTVTQSLWEGVMGENPSQFKGENRPVENVSWDDAQEFIGKMNDMKPELKLQLPTEAQWEYACRAGSTTPFCWGEQINSELVNFDGTNPYNNGRKSEFRRETIYVESFYQNDWGLWQMHGNVLEWCQDWYGDYPEKNATDPVGPETGDNRVLRGGSWLYDGRYCRSAYRYYRRPVDSDRSFGFRLARGH